MFLPNNIEDIEILELIKSNAIDPSEVTQAHVDAFRRVHYHINRKKRYPAHGEQLDMQFHGTWDRYIKEIKDGWPKPAMASIRRLQKLNLKDPRKLFPGSDVLDLMTALTYGNFRNKSSSIVVVGSSVSLLGKSLGKQIDRYENVVRVNWYPTTKRFQEDIGSKEDIVVIKTSGGPNRETKRKLNTDRDKYHNCKMKPRKIWVANMMAGTIVNQATKDFMQECYNTTNFAGYGDMARGFAQRHGLSGFFTGTQAIVLAHLITGEPVDIVGFCGTSYDTYRHYYDSAAVSYKIHHGGDNEDEAIIKLLELGVIGRVLDLC
jgi:hypothetical protein